MPRGKPRPIEWTPSELENLRKYKRPHGPGKRERDRYATMYSNAERIRRNEAATKFVDIPVEEPPKKAANPAPPVLVSGCSFIGVSFDARSIEAVKVVAEGLAANARALGDLARVFACRNVNFECLLKLPSAEVGLGQGMHMHGSSIRDCDGPAMRKSEDTKAYEHKREEF